MPYSAPGPFLGAQTASAYQISRSLRFRSSASAYLSRTPASAGNLQKWTWSGWVKRGALSNAPQFLMGSGTNGTNDTSFYFTAADKIDYYTRTSSTIQGYVTTNAVFRDPSAWYHVVIVYDSANATAANRMIVYVNNVSQSLTVNNTLPQSTNGFINATVGQYIGTAQISNYLDGYLAEVNFIDGSALLPTSFGQSNALTGVWEPKQYTGTYSGNSFYLPFNPSAQSNGNDSYTTALLHFDNTLTLNSAVGGSTTWSSSGSTVATNSTNGITNFNNSATFTAANTDYITSTASSDYNFTGDFTIDFWYRPTSTSNQTIFRDVSTTDWNTCSTGDYACFIDGVRYIAFQIKGVGGPYDTAALTANTWYHVAIVRSGSTITLYKDGTSVSTFSYSGTIGNTKALEIGRAITNYTASGIDGRVDEFRVSKGIARWTANFTRPSLPYGQSIGADASGAGNYWEAYNVNAVSSGTTYDSMIDSPTNYADGGNGRGNYAVWNSLSNAATYADANLSVTTTNNSAPYNAETTIKTPSSGKWYAEITLSAKGAGNPAIGIGNNNPDQFACYRVNGTYVTGSMGASSTGTPATFTTNDIIGVAFDADNGTLNFYKNGSLQTGGFTGITAGNYSFILREDSTSGDGAILNCGQRPFTYSNYGTDRPAATFLALNTQNLPTPTIAAGNKYFDATTYTGNGTSQSITNNGSFQPDLVWIKPRVAAGTSHVLTDAVRGVSKFLSSNGTSAESSVPGFQLTAFNSNGFTLVDNANGDYGVNGASGGTYSGTPPNFIAWQWNAGGAPTTDNVAGAGNVPTAGSVKINGANSSSALAGSIAATRISANTSAGFSVVTYTGTGTAGTVGHGLGVAPSMIIAKSRSATGKNWPVYHSANGTPQNNVVYLNLTLATSSSAGQWNTTAPTSSVFSVGGSPASGYDDVNLASATQVAYCFAPVAGYSAFGSYTGNGSTDGPFVYTGFRPRWVICKRADSTSDWIINDTTRDAYNNTSKRLFANDPGVESGTYDSMDILSNGIKMRNTNSLNQSGGTYIYAAFAENPFKYSRAR